MWSRLQLWPTVRSDPELLPFRAGLTFAFYNALAWQIGIGTPMVLFAEQLGASPFQVGLAYAFVFILTPIQILSTPLIPRFGFKRVMLGGWRTRSLFLSVPAVLAAWALVFGPQGWMVHALVWSVFFFCFFRSIGAAAAIPWFYGILPKGTHGRYWANDQMISSIGGVATLLACAALFATLPVYWALLLQYLIALGGSTVSYFSLRKLPDAERPLPISLASVLRDTPRHMIRKTPFRRYLWLAVAYAAMTTPIPPFAAYYLKAVAHRSTGQIMLCEVLRYSGVMVAAWLIRRHIDHVGAKPFFRLAMLLFVAVGGFWWCFLHWGVGGAIGIGAAYFLTGAGAATWAVANLNYLPKVTSAEERTLLVSIHGAITACLGGLAPMLWGLALKGETGSADSFHIGVFAWFFVSVVVGAVVLGLLVVRLEETVGRPVEPIQIGGALFRPFRAMTSMVGLFDTRRGDAGKSEHQP